MTARFARQGGMLAMLMLLAGCISFGGKAPAQMIGLTPTSTAPAGAMASGSLANAILVLDPQTERRLDNQRVLVQVDDSNVAYLKDVAWAERPARMFGHLLAETIRAKGSRVVLEASDQDTEAKTKLAGRLIDMGYDARSQSVVVRYDALREDAPGQVVARRFEAVVPGVAPKAQAVAPALNKAANDVAAQVADWIG